MANDFQLWIIDKGYYRNKKTGMAWAKDGVIATGKELNELLKEWKELTTH